MKRFLVTLFGSFFYTGFFVFAPASFASLVWLLLYLFIPGGSWLVSPSSLVILTPIAIYLSWEMERYYGEDASEIVIDEFVGMQVTFFAMDPSISVGIAGFILFRIFDILKPFPVGELQKLKGGLGVVADDVLAGIYARIVLYLLIRFIYPG